MIIIRHIFYSMQTPSSSQYSVLYPQYMSMTYPVLTQTHPPISIHRPTFIISVHNQFSHRLTCHISIQCGLPSAHVHSWSGHNQFSHRPTCLISVHTQFSHRPTCLISAHTQFSHRPTCLTDPSASFQYIPNSHTDPPASSQYSPSCHTDSPASSQYSVVYHQHMSTVGQDTPSSHSSVHHFYPYIVHHWREQRKTIKPVKKGMAGIISVWVTNSNFHWFAVTANILPFISPGAQGSPVTYGTSIWLFASAY